MAEPERGGSRLPRISAKTVSVVLALTLCATAGMVSWHLRRSGNKLNGFVGFIDDTVDLGRRYLPEPMCAEYEFLNNSTNPVTVSERLCCGLRGEWPDGRHVLPGQRVRFWLTWNGGPGKLDRTIYVIAADSAIPLRMSAEVMAGVGVSPKRAFCEIYAEQDHPKEIVLQLAADDGTPFRILSARVNHEQVAMGKLPLDELRLTHSVVLLAVPGDKELSKGSVEIRTSHPRAPELAVPVMVTTLSDVGLQPSAFLLPSTGRQSHVTVFSRSGRTFDVLCESAPDGMRVTSSTADKTAYFLTLEYQAVESPPASHGEVILFVDGIRRSIPVVVRPAG